MITLFLILIAGVFLAEMYKMSFEKSIESKDERGRSFIYKTKSLSYSFLSYGTVVGVILVAILKVLPQEYFIYYIMVLFFAQSVFSSGYLFFVRKTE